MHSGLDDGLSHTYGQSPTRSKIVEYSRVCAGRHMAENTIWLTIASVLATFTLGKAKDGKGNEIDIPGEYTDQFFRYISLHRYLLSHCSRHPRHPKPYRSSIIPRSALARELVLATDAE